jgi:hypothetical protein
MNFVHILHNLSRSRRRWKHVAHQMQQWHNSKNLTFGISTTIELKNIRTTPDNTGTILTRNIAHYMPLLSDIAVILLSWIVVLTANGQFLDCTTVAFSSKRYVPPKRRYQRMPHVITNTTMGIFTSMNGLKSHKCPTITTIRNKTKAQCCYSLPVQAASTNTGKLSKNWTSVGVLHASNCRHFHSTCLHKEETRQTISYEVTRWDVSLTFIPPRLSYHFIRIYFAGGSEFLVIMFLKYKNVAMETDQCISLVSTPTFVAAKNITHCHGNITMCCLHGYLRNFNMF